MKVLHASHGLAVVASLALLAMASNVNAQPSPAPAAAPVSEEKPGAHTHDGFYFRFAAGLGLLNAAEKAGNVEAKLKGIGTAWELVFGGTPVPGLVIGGSLFTHIVKPSYEVAGVSRDSTNTIFLLSIGPMVDYFIDPKAGFHFGGGIGYGTLNAINYTSTGGALHLHAGYDFWIGNNWSVRPMLRLTGASTSKDPYKDTTTSVALFVTLLDH